MPSERSSISFVDQLGAELGALLIERISPEESEFYAQIVDSYRENAAKGRKKVAEQPLALGIGEIVAVLSPVAYEAGKIAVGCILDLAKDTAKDTLKEAAKDTLAPRISLWFKSQFASQAPVELDLSKIDEIVAEVRDKLGKRGVEPVLSEKIANAVRGLLQQTPAYEDK